MAEDSASGNQLDELAEEFVARFRSGERPALTEFTGRYPELADEIRELFPALVMMEDVRPDHTGTAPSFDKLGPRSLSGERLERLGDYRILREVGRGGMGIVYEAEQESLGRHVALKVLPTYALLDPRHFQRFQREARAAARLHHTNIVPVFGVGAQEGLNYFVMQFIQGLGLDQVLSELKRLRSRSKTGSYSVTRVRSRGSKATQSRTAAANASPEAENRRTDAVPRSETGHSAGQTDAVPRSETGHSASAASASPEVPSPAPTKSKASAPSPQLPPNHLDQSAELIAEALLTGEFHRRAGELRSNSHSTATVIAVPHGTSGTANTASIFPSPNTDRLPQHQSPSSSDSSIVHLPGQPENASLSQSGLSYWLSVARIGAQVADALAYAHGQGVIHRDIKPSNLLLDTQGTVWVADFGLAKATDSDDLTRTGDIVGTLRYLAPEQLKGESGGRSDIYSLGATLYEMLTLFPMFEEADRNRLIQQVAQQEPRAPRTIDTSIPLDLETIVLKAIAKDPSDRYATALELAADLRRFLEDKPIHARRVGPGERLWRWGRRNPVIAGLIATVAALLVFAVVILSISNSRIRAETVQKETALKTARENERRALANAELAKKTADEREEQRRIAVENETLARRRFYAAQMNLADQAIGRKQLARVLDLLDSQKPAPGQADLRGFEWFHLWREIHRALHVSFRQTGGEIWCLSFSPDGKSLAVGNKCGDHGGLQLWDVETGQLKADLADSQMDVVAGAEFSPDGKLLASGSADKQIRIWDIARHSLVVEPINLGAVIRSLRWSHSVNLIAAGCQNGTVHIIDPQTWKVTSVIRDLKSPVLGLAFSADGKNVISAVAWGEPSRRTVVHDITVSPPRLLHDFKRRFVTDASPTDKRIVSYDDDMLHIWDPDNPDSMNKLPVLAGWLNNVRFSPDATRIATAGFEERVATVWDVENGRAVVQGAHAQAIQVVAISPNQRYWASASTDGEVKIWHYEIPPETNTIAHDQDIHRMFVLPGTQTVILGGPFTAVAREIETAKPVDFPSIQHLRTISADGRVVVAAVPDPKRQHGETIQVWDRESGTMRMSWQLPDRELLYYECIAVSKTGRWLATRANNQSIRVWDLSQPEARQVQEFTANCIAMVFSPNEEILAAACQFGRVLLWNVKDGKKLPALQGNESGSDWAQCVCFSPDGKRVAGGTSSGIVQVWDVASCQLLTQLKGQLGEVKDVIFFPDGRRLAVASVGSIALWEVDVKQELITLNTPNQKAVFLAVASDAATLLSRHEDGQVHIWKSRHAVKNERD